MTNRLAVSNSPYLLQHAENPVDWYPWSEEALEAAQEANKPIFLSIGYAACHWCHVMAHESFENSDTASILNEHFISIKVDREERPDLDDIYMSAVVAINGQAGWPMSVFLTPEGHPFFAGTYFPPLRRYNLPSFREILLTIARLWKDDQQKLIRSSQEITNYLISSHAKQATHREINFEMLNQVANKLAQAYDWKYGGWGQAPKFPQPMAIEFLLNRAARGDKLALDIAVHALRSMAKGGMYDIVGGGFARYSTDNEWHIPHFEKMLYDNAQLALAYLHAYLLTNDRFFCQVCEETLDFILHEMRDSNAWAKRGSGGFFSSLDADSDGIEGEFYTWTYSEIEELIKGFQGSLETDYLTDSFKFFSAAYGLSPEGNFEGKIVLLRRISDEKLAQEFSLSLEQARKSLKDLSQVLFKARSRRTRPFTDDKVLTSWNGLALLAFSEAARYLNRLDYLEVSRQVADFLLNEMHSNGRLMRSWRNGVVQGPGYLEDYGALIIGLLSLYQSDFQNHCYSAAISLAQEMLDQFYVPGSGFFDTGNDHEHLLYRPMSFEDNATPSGGALAVSALILLSKFNGDSRWRQIVENVVSDVIGYIVVDPIVFCKWLCAIDILITQSIEIALLLQSGSQFPNDFIRIIWSKYRPDLVLAVSHFPPTPDAPPLLLERPLRKGVTTAYVCKNFICKQPVTSPDELRQQLES